MIPKLQLLNIQFVALLRNKYSVHARLVHYDIVLLV